MPDADAPLTAEEIRARIDEVAVEADTVVCVEVSLGSAVLPKEDGTFGPEDAQLVLYATLYEPVSERIVRLPILFDFGLALDFGIGPVDVVKEILNEAVEDINKLLATIQKAGK